jgi:hypothetical protein
MLGAEQRERETPSFRKTNTQHGVSARPVHPELNPTHLGLARHFSLAVSPCLSRPSRCISRGMPTAFDHAAASL